MRGGIYVRILGCHEGQVDQIPTTNSGTSVEEELEVEVADTGVHLGTHEEVIDPSSGVLYIVGMSREVQSLKQLAVAHLTG